MSTGPRGLIELFGEVVEAHASAVALRCGERTLTYAELDRRAAARARALRSIGITPADLVPVAAERSVEAVVNMLALLACGAAYVPIDGRHSTAYVRQIVADTGATCVIVGPGTPIEHLEVFGDLGLRAIDAGGSEPSEPSGEGLTAQAAPAPEPRVAYAMYTSGSTGRPKGVLVPHRAIVRLVRGSSFARMGADQVWLHQSSPAFDASTLELWAPLLNGGTCVIVPDALLTVARLRELIDSGVTSAWFTSTFFNALLDEQPMVFRGLQQVLTGGEALSPRHVETALRNNPDVTFVNGYGPTENTTFTCTHDLSLTDVTSGGGIPIGRAIHGTTVHVLDEALEPVADGEVGELCVGGAGLAIGYLARPDLTRERFVEHRLAAEPDERLYRTGDRCRRRADGVVEFVGRADRQVKLRGFRIELADVEHHLARIAGVTGEAALLREDPSGAQRLVAYAAVGSNGEPRAEALRAALAAALPAYSVPDHVVVLERLPVSLNGKLDTDALPSPWSESETARHAASSAPDGDPLEALRRAVRDVLARDAVAASDSLAGLGATSLQAMRIASRVETELGVVVSLRDLLAGATLEDLAAELAAAAPEPSPPPTAALPSASDRGRPLSFAQRRIWFLEQLAAGGGPSPVMVTLRTGDRLDVSALERALSTIVERHEVLRTVYSATDGEPRQHVCRPTPVRLERRDVSEHDVRTSGFAQDAARELSQRAFDLSRDPVHRFLLLDGSPGPSVLLVCIHHIAADAWSMEVLLTELNELYAAFVGGRPPELEALAIQYSDHAARQRAAASGGAFTRALDYWRARLAALPDHASLTPDRARTPDRSRIAGESSVTIPADDLDALHELSRAHGVTLFMTLLTAYAVLIRRHSGQSDVVIGSPIAGRARADVQPLVGVFLNNLVLRTDLSEQPTFATALERVRTTVLDAIRHQDVPFEVLVDELRPPRRTGQTPLFQLFFNMAEVSDPESGGAFAFDRFDIDRPHYDLTLYASPTEDGLTVRGVFDAQLFTPERISELLAQYARLLGALPGHADRSIAAFDLVTPSSATMIGDPAEPLCADAPPSTAEMFDRVATKFPDAIAVSHGSARLTYDELRRWSLAIAAEIGAKTRAGDAVAVTGRRGLALIASALGVLRTHAVLVLLDPALPAQRRETVLSAGRVRLLVRTGGESGPDGASLPGLDVPAVYPQQLDTGPPKDSAPYPTGSAPCYVFFTSGTTGTPKAVLGCHAGLSHFLDWQRSEFDVGRADRVAQLTALSFDVVLRDVFLPLVSGARLCLPGESVDLSSKSVMPWMKSEGVTLLHAVPALAGAWLDAMEGPADAPSLRTVFFAGEPLRRALVERWRRTFGAQCEVVNLYGPTETTLAKYFHRVATPPAPGVQPVGQPLPGTQALVVTESGALCGLEELGEIVIRTPFRSLGYVDAEGGLTVFEANPFSADPTDLVYRTGDVGRLSAAGLLHVHGRLDDQVKIRGVRIEPGEIAAKLAQHPSVAACAVVASKADDGSVALHAYYVAPEDSLPTITELRRHLRRALPPALIPSSFIAVSRMPLLPNGKLDRAALLSAGGTALDDVERDIVAPRTSLERELHSIWSDVLDHSPIGVHDDFFALGGHSLMAVRLVGRVADRLDKRVPLVTIFHAPTIAQFAEHLAHRDEPGENGDSSSDVVSFNAAGDGRALFALPGIGGTAAFTFRGLAASLGEHQPVHGLQLRGSDGQSAPHSTVEEMAAYQIVNIRRIQPQGPYALIGYSFGGRLAFEIAAQLRDAGERVELLAMIDSSAPGYPRVAALPERLKLHFAELRAGGWLGALRYAGERVRRIGDRGRAAMQRLRPPEIAPGDSPQDQLETLAAVTRIAAKRYSPRVIDQDLLLFRSAQKSEWLGASHDDPCNGWGDFAAGEIDVQPLVGTHIDAMSDANVRVIADALRARRGAGARVRAAQPAS